MSTKLTEHPNHWTVETVAGKGRQRKIGRGAVRVGKNDPEKLKAEMLRQAKAARVAFGVDQPSEEPVV